ncbi:hypothetical protein [Shinella sp. M27]|uniref:hypothetical protein n=1 Tax=Shinella sp. M27 TaxID=3368614 RepID=UPI003BA05921
MTDIPICADPIPKEVIAYCRSVSTTDKMLDYEKRAYVDFCERYAKERSKRKKIVMQNMLNHLLLSKVHGMKPSHALNDALSAAFQQEKEAEKTLYPLEIHSEVAHILTSATYTVGRGKSTAWTIHTGGWYSEFRGEGRKAFAEWSAGEILGSYVKFGAHHFSIGATTQRILSMLEERYGLDFKQLEKDRVNKQKTGNR